MEDDLRPEYDIANLRVWKLGPGRTMLTGLTVVQLEPDVAEMFPDSDAVNQALRFLMRIVANNKAVLGSHENPNG
jgi:hypothetical protein